MRLWWVIRWLLLVWSCLPEVFWAVGPQIYLKVMPSKRVKLGRSEINALFRSIQDEVHAIVTSLYDAYGLGSQTDSMEAAEGLMLPSIFSRLAQAHDHKKGLSQHPVPVGLSAGRPRFLQPRSARLILDTGFHPSQQENEAARSDDDKAQKRLELRGNRLVTELNRVLSEESVLKSSYPEFLNASSTAVLSAYRNSSLLQKVLSDVPNTDKGSTSVSHVRKTFLSTRRLSELGHALIGTTDVSTVLDSVEQERKRGKVAEKFRKQAGVSRGAWKNGGERHQNGSLDGGLWDLEHSEMAVR